MAQAKPSRMRAAFYTLGFMAAATAVCVAGVSVAYHATRNRIILNEITVMQRAVLEAAGMDWHGIPAEIEKRYKANVDRIPENGKLKYYRIKGGGYVFPASGPGLWGRIDAVVGLKPDLKTITGVSFIRQNETPGLGARIEEPWFRKQFRDKRGPMSMKAEKEPIDDSQFNAITGATITSTAVKDMVNRTLQTAPGIVGGKEKLNGER